MWQRSGIYRCSFLADIGRCSIFLFLVAIFSCANLTGCGEANPYDLNAPLIKNTLVKLPYEETLNKGGLRISLQSIPGRTDAIRAEAKMYGFYESPTVKWMQEGCSVRMLSLDKGLERYDFEFSELRSSNNAVTEVKISIVSRAKSGPR